MNNAQLQEFLTELGETPNVSERRDDVDFCRKILAKTAPNTIFAINYIASNYTDVDLVQPILGQLLALYYKGGVLRLYVLQYVPGLVSLYLLALAKKQQKSVSLVEEVRIPSIRYPSIYHDPAKLQGSSEVTTLRPGPAPSVQTTVRLGPYPTTKSFTAENKFLVLTRILKSVNSSLFIVSSEVTARFICLCTLSVCRSGFFFPETGFRNKVLETEHSQEIVEDYSRKPRQQVNGSFLLELIYGAYLALFNGAADLALRAIDAVHLRSQYELLPDVLLVVNSIRNSLLDDPLSKVKRDELLWTKAYNKDGRRKQLVTSASLRMKRMPEDIPVQEQAKEKEHSRFGELVEEGMDHLHDLKKKVVNMGLHHKAMRRRKSLDHDDTPDLQTIKEERNGAETRGDMSPSSENAIVLNDEDLERRLRDITVVEHDYSARADSPKKEEPKKEEEGGEPSSLEHRGSFSVSGLRHADSDDLA
ncbi:unnamed protein product [Caenorhabditis auriculariae]|uniref:Uncharacterized protein n=1 Tax=Caenorhabditis auriculariae TaxID=2777116 RepID=A0A8S1H661_9PELO|nr:unnamed protein product [Caenorhabditis auriculariae]